MSKPLSVGPKSAAWLRQVGIRTHEDLEAAGAVAAFVKCKRAGFRPSLNLLYALEGALQGCHWQKVPEERRAELAEQAAADIADIPPSRSRAASLKVTAVRELSGEEIEEAGIEGDFIPEDAAAADDDA